MDLQSFIQSGLLEAYVAGQCSAEERKQVEQMIARHPEIRAELDRIELALEQLAQAGAVAPPAHLKNNILNQLDMSTESATTSAQDQPAGGRKYMWILLAALGWALAAFLFLQQNNRSGEIKALEKQKSELQQQVDDCAKRRTRTDPMAALLRDTDTRPVTLTDGKAYHITVFNNEVRKECALDVTGVPTPDQGGYLQCWALMADGTPIDLGMVQMDAPAGWQPLKYVEKAIGYAISVEKNPQGNPRPTQVLASGNIPAG